MRTKTLIALSTCLAYAALVAGCSDEAGTPTTSSQQPTQTSQPDGGNLPHSGAPKVEVPIADTSKWEANPCSVIGDEQLSSIGLKSDGAKPNLEGSAGPACDWGVEVGFGSAFTGGFATINPEGLSRIYASHAAGKFGVFTALSPIEGYPAVRAEKKDESAEGMCSTTVGIRDNLNYDVVVTLDADSPQGKDPCKIAQEIAALAVKTMKGGS